MTDEKEDKPLSPQSSEQKGESQQDSKRTKIKRKNTRKSINYYSFIKLPHNYDFFPNPDHSEYIGMAESIRSLLVRELQIKPLSTSQIDRVLSKINPDYPYALDYIFQTAADDSDSHYPVCKQATEMITRGMEIRTRGNRDYWGLTSKLDSK